MKPYGVKVIENPDVADIHAMGAKSRVGKAKTGRGYCRPGPKARTRRYWKRKARAEGRATCEVAA